MRLGLIGALLVLKGFLMKVTFYLGLTSKGISCCKGAAYRVIYTGKWEIVRKCWN